MENAKVYLLDVEGTVAPLSLTTGQLFPYARKHFESFLRDYFADLEKKADLPLDMEEGSVLRDLAMLQLENRNETDPDAPSIVSDHICERHPNRPVSMTPVVGIPRVLAYVYWLMDRDRKSTALKSLQGKIWKAGFESGELKGTLFEDVPPGFARWTAKGKVAIYSSGSVESQLLLFRYSIFGDLTPFISAHFDTRTGSKMEPESYAAIARAMQVHPGEVVFFSDVVKELNAARVAGMQTRLMLREGNAPVTDARGHESVTSLSDS